MPFEGPAYRSSARANSRIIIIIIRRRALVRESRRRSRQGLFVACVPCGVCMCLWQIVTNRVNVCRLLLRILCKTWPVLYVMLLCAHTTYKRAHAHTHTHARTHTHTYNEYESDPLFRLNATPGITFQLKSRVSRPTSTRPPARTPSQTTGFEPRSRYPRACRNNVCRGHRPAVSWPVLVRARLQTSDASVTVRDFVRESRDVLGTETAASSE